MFVSQLETTGASKVYNPMLVPTDASIVIIRVSSFCDIGCHLHCTEVDDVHAEVAHAARDIVDVDVKSYCPKLKPVTVTELLPLRGMFDSLVDATGTSKLYNKVAVPATAPTVTMLKSWMDATGCAMHLTADELDHEAVEHSAAESRTEAVNSSLPKFSPPTVTDDLPLTAALVIPCETAGPSNVKLRSVPVPATALTVNRRSSAVPTKLTDAHWSDVELVQLTLAHEVTPRSDVGV